MHRSHSSYSSHHSYSSPFSTQRSNSALRLVEWERRINQGAAKSATGVSPEGRSWRGPATFEFSVVRSYAARLVDSSLPPDHRPRSEWKQRLSTQDSERVKKSSSLSQ